LFGPEKIKFRIVADFGEGGVLAALSKRKTLGKKRTLVRISDGSGVFMTDITIDNCVISEVGTDGYGMINFGKNIDQLEKVSITNSTLINIGDQLMDVKGGIVTQLSIVISVMNTPLPSLIRTSVRFMFCIAHPVNEIDWA